MPVEAGIYRLNQVKNPEAVRAACTQLEDSVLPQTFVPYEEQPREYFLNAVSTVLDVHTRISDLYSSPHDQIKEQLRLTIETIKELQESQLINNPDYGLLANVTDEQRIFPLTGAPTPDDLDELLTKVWKGRILPHAPARDRRVRPRMHAARCAAADGQPVRFAVPHVARHPADPVGQGAGRGRQDQDPAAARRRQAPGVVGLYQPGVAGEQGPGLSVRFMGINNQAIASYLISLYCSLAVHSPDALAVLDDVEIAKFHDYPDTYR